MYNQVISGVNDEDLSCSIPSTVTMDGNLGMAYRTGPAGGDILLAADLPDPDVKHICCNPS